MSKPMMKWTAEADQKLLLLIIDKFKINHVDVAREWQTVYPADAVHPTPMAVSKHVQKLKEGIKGSGGVPSTPRSANTKKTACGTPKASQTPKTPTSTKRKGGKSLMSDDDDDEEEDDDDQEEVDLKFVDLPKRNTPSRRAAIKRPKYSACEFSDDDEVLATPKQEPKEDQHNIMATNVEDNARDSVVEEVGDLGRRSIARSKKNSNFGNLEAADDSDDDFILGF